MNNLPYEILMKIFIDNNRSDLLNIEQCCRSFYNIINNNYFVSKYFTPVISYQDNINNWKHIKNKYALLTKIINALKNKQKYSHNKNRNIFGKICNSFIDFRHIADDSIIITRSSIFVEDDNNIIEYYVFDMSLEQLNSSSNISTVGSTDGLHRTTLFVSNFAWNIENDTVNKINLSDGKLLESYKITLIKEPHIVYAYDNYIFINNKYDNKIHTYENRSCIFKFDTVDQIYKFDEYFVMSHRIDDTKYFIYVYNNKFINIKTYNLYDIDHYELNYVTLTFDYPYLGFVLESNVNKIAYDYCYVPYIIDIRSDTRICFGCFCSLGICIGCYHLALQQIKIINGMFICLIRGTHSNNNIYGIFYDIHTNSIITEINFTKFRNKATDMHIYNNKLISIESNDAHLFKF